MNASYTQELTRLGLSPEQASIYEYLLKEGPSPASRIAKTSTLKRGLAYKVLDQLIEIGLVTKKDAPGAVAVFEPLHPGKLAELVALRQKEAENAAAVLSTHLGSLVSLFNLVSGKPGVSFYEGLDGVKRIYDDILDTGQDVLLVRSIHDKDKAFDFIPAFIRKRVAKNISVTAITPNTPDANHDLAVDEANLFTRTWVDARLYKDPVEIDIYGDKVAMIHLADPLTGTIIQHPAIAQAMRALFTLMRLGAQHPNSSVITEDSLK